VEDRQLAPLVTALEELPQLRRLRIHTRMPVVLPERIDAGLLAWLGDTRLQTVVVIHANHARELDDSVTEALTRLRGSGAVLLNQSVLLHGVNDTAERLVALSEALFAHSVHPYYLHQLDQVEGAAHFAVSDGAARALMAELRAQLPGYLVPRLVREEAGAPAKCPL